MSKSLPDSVDVLIVGGGPAGLATAIAARRLGMSVVVADGAVPPIDKACGEGLMPDGLEALRNLGVIIPGDHGYPFRGIRFINGSQKSEATFPRGTAVGIRRTVLHQVLIDHAAAAGALLQWHSPVGGLRPSGALIAGNLLRARWIVGADGAASRVRQWAGLDAFLDSTVRFAARRHYRVSPWTDFMELHWSSCSQIYVTPVGREEVAVAVISNRGHLKLDQALPDFPALSRRLAHAEHASTERGATTGSRRLRRIWRDNVALVGDASCGVDAITGEGICLAFRQSALLAECLASGNLARYQKEHAKIIRRPALMARLMLLMAKHDRLRGRTMQVFESSPESFASMLSMHVGAGTTRDYISNGISLGWQLLGA